MFITAAVYTANGGHAWASAVAVSGRDILSYSDEFVLKWVPALETVGFQLHMHTIGDAAVSQALDALELSRQTNGMPNRRSHQQYECD